MDRDGSQAVCHSTDFPLSATKVPRCQSRTVRSACIHLRALRASAADLRKKLLALLLTGDRRSVVMHALLRRETTRMILGRP
jgi:hypothetical protein